VLTRYPKPTRSRHVSGPSEGGSALGSMPSSSRRPRVLVVTPDYPPAKGGIQLLTERLVQNWHAVDSHVITTAAAPREYTETTAGVSRVPRPPVGGSISALAALNGAALLKAARYRPDVVLSSHIIGSPAARSIRRMLGVPYVQYVHGQEIVARPGLAAFAMRRAAAVVAVSTFTERLALDRGAPPTRLRRIPPGVDLPTATPRPRADRPTIVTVARLTERYKGHDVLIRALPVIREVVPNVQWVVVGDGPERASYETEVHARGLDGSVTFLGVVDDRERDAWLDRGHVFAMPSRLSDDGGGEGFGIVYLEAGAHGLPVIAGDVAGARDAVIDGETGRLVDPTDHHKVAEAAIELLTNHDLSRQMGGAGQRNARDLAWPRIAIRVEQVLLELTGTSESL
jgi:phosphatidylinositol alpha-1,6-mannosyltransferase